MSLDLAMGVRYIKGVGEAREKMMKKLGISTLLDLVSFFPRAYEDRTVIKNIDELTIGEAVCIRAAVVSAPQLTHVRQGLGYVKLSVTDESGIMEITFFNQSYLKDTLKQGEIYFFYGKISGDFFRPTMVNPLFEKDKDHGTITGRLMPIYPLTSGLNQRSIVSAIRAGLDKCGEELPEVLPESVIRQYELCRISYAYENIHFPTDFQSLNIARHRLIFEELFTLAIAMKHLRSRRSEAMGTSLKLPDIKEFYAVLPFEPTNAQKRAIDDALMDMMKEQPMNRLIQGDVGSGKTLVAAACCWSAWRSGYQAAFMVPTEVLANQHFNSLTELLEPFGIRVDLLTGSLTAKHKREMHEKLRFGEIDLIIGTHALISQGVSFSNLALVITDEQHRFGVNQRSMLSEKGDSPHVLVMSATPIPRTLALIVYGDLDVSIIDEMPPGRQEIKTYIVGENYRQRINNFIRKLVGEGRQVFVICPMVEEEEDDDEDALVKNDLKSAQKHYELFKNELFPDLHVALVHGKMKAKEKDAAMLSFTNGESDILVATTVIEVGIDVPNAALIVVENAERFGLSQLHQLRGRVGRGKHESFCILFNGETASEATKERLAVMQETNDGFKIAEEDLKMRGPGDFFGSRQHGLPELRIANLASDMLVLSQAQEAAKEILDDDPNLEKSENRFLANEITRLFEINADSLN
ncbi:MAG: ATP-dependent DNA helicase RecG [Oscillospiraceae bacterium]|nr:ATP-dependent DNA helicase RecG [Oscillospiraceae bacterium]